MDVSSGAVFDATVRYLKENPWDRMRIFSNDVFQNTHLMYGLEPRAYLPLNFSQTI